MATVTLAEDTVLQRQVALKRVRGVSDRSQFLRLKREALAGASLNHPNLVFVFDAQLLEDGDAVIVMEYVEGQTLADVIAARGALPPEEALSTLRGIAAALDAIHEQGIVHRDVKPANVLLAANGAVKLADLGVADVADRTRITSSGAIVGSFSYMAPEQLNGARPSPAMDIYALSAVVYEMLTGQKARSESNPLALARAIATQPPPDLLESWPEAPRAAAEELKRGMSANPARRPRSAGELARRLETAFASAPAPRVRDVPPPRAPADPRDVPPPRAPADPRDVPPPRAPADPRSVEAKPLRSERRDDAVLPPPLPSRPRHNHRIVVPVLLATAVLAVLVVALANAGGNGSRNRPATKPPHHRVASTHHPSGRSPGGTGTSGPTSTTTQTATNPTTPPVSTRTPAGALESFYTDAAAHQYPAAWALADPHMRSEVGGYAAFQNQMSSVRSIVFQRAQVLGHTGSGAATVAVDTTSFQTDRTQRCSGTATMVKDGGRWLVDAISINCTPS